MGTDNRRRPRDRVENTRIKLQRGPAHKNAHKTSPRFHAENRQRTRKATGGDVRRRAASELNFWPDFTERK
jgi:hypothetical protein